MSKTALVVAETTIQQDHNGLYRLNDLHQAAGGEQRHKPANWLRNEQTRCLINELTTSHIRETVPGIPGTGVEEMEAEEINSGNSQSLFEEVTPGIPGVKENQYVSVVNGGTYPGTYVCKELVYAYANWISPKFYLSVIRAYDALVTGKLNIPEFSNPKTAGQLIQLCRSSGKMVELTKQAAQEKDPFIRQQTLAILKNYCDATGTEFIDPALIGTRTINDHPDVVQFWNVFERINKGAHQPFNHSNRPDQEIAVHINQVLSYFQDAGIDIADRSTLIDRLRTSQRHPFIDRQPIRSRLWKKTVRCLIFKRA